ncbi:MAG: hypothetical protein LUG93_19395 [Lachnospiraceae bacterium]|nr:hypothetical protein [Lachnospiraceae bacterium]
MNGYEIEYKCRITGKKNIVCVEEEKYISALTCLQELGYMVFRTEWKENTDKELLNAESFGYVIDYWKSSRSESDRVFVAEDDFSAVSDELQKKGYKVWMTKWTNRVLEGLDIPVMEV